MNVDADPRPARLALPNMLFKDLRAAEVWRQRGAKNGAPSSSSWAAEPWLERFDIADDEVMGIRAKLLDEPKLTAATTLPDAIRRPNKKPE